MERELLVHLDLPGAPVLVGRLWSRIRGAKESATRWGLIARRAEI